MIPDTGYFIDIMFALGMGLCFFSLDPKSPTSRALALFFVMVGLDMLASYKVYFGAMTWIGNMLIAPVDSLMLCVAYEWLLRVSRTTSPERQHRTAVWFRVAQGFAVLVGMAEEGQGLMELAAGGKFHAHPVVGYAGVPVLAFLVLSIAIAVAAVIQVARSQADPAERVRLAALAWAGPFMAVGGFALEDKLQGKLTFLGIGIGEVIFFSLAVRYHYMQGQRGEFLSRFLSAELTQQVRERGLASVLRQDRAEITVVSCDLRGFAAFSESAAPEELTRLLRDYYDRIGAAISEFGGTIKDITGDGVLALIGAPLPRADHASRAISLARKMRDNCDEMLRRWGSVGLELGLGIGVASGFVTVGALGGGGRLEYVAVGPAVNLASRICARAAPGQILLDQRTVGLASADGADFRFERLEAAELKGFARPVSIFALAA